MTQVIAAIDGGSLTDRICAIAAALGRTLAAEAVALQVQDDHTAESPNPEACGLPLRLVQGHPIDAILAAIQADDVVAAVLGAGGRPHKAVPVGHVVLGVLLGVTKPVVVVPPRASVPNERIRRIFVPLEDDPRSTHAVRDVVRYFQDRSAEIVVVHVFDDRDPLRFADRPSRDAAIWGEEFLLRSGQPSAGLRLARGTAPVGVVEAIESGGPDLMVASWSRRLEPGRAEVIRRLLETAPVPVLLVPADGDLRP
jgi:nucleotide-binding universal stress UspA family protein